MLCCAVLQMVCAVSQVQQPGDYLCGTLGDVRYLIIRGQDGQLRAFHNVSVNRRLWFLWSSHTKTLCIGCCCVGHTYPHPGALGAQMLLGLIVLP
jgi:choline monooxygenase